jgi:cadmium resistance protein CadD (predicted permease)
MEEKGEKKILKIGLHLSQYVSGAILASLMLKFGPNWNLPPFMVFVLYLFPIFVGIFFLLKYYDKISKHPEEGEVLWQYSLFCDRKRREEEADDEIRAEIDQLKREIKRIRG